MKRKIIFALFMLFIIFSSVCFAMEASNQKIYNGIDISQWQGNINFEKVKKDGIEIVYIKASQGESFKDPYFETNYKKAKENNLKIGVYHFLSAKNISEARDQADFFSAIISKKEIDCRLAMDFEEFGRLTKKEINDISKEFLTRVEEKTRKETIIYSDSYNAKNIFDKELAERYPIWIAEYGVRKPSKNDKWKVWVGFQYKDNARISGIRGYVDADYYTSSILLKEHTVLPENTHRNKEKNNIKVIRVRRGDTLSKIAIKYNTSISEITALNNIKNRNLIYMGEKLKIYYSEYDNLGETNHYIYTIKRGDTLFEISKKFKVSIRELIRINNIKNPNKIYAGERLKIEIK